MNAGLYARVLLGQRLCAPRDGQSEHRGFADDRCSAYDSLSTLLLDPVRRRTITTFPQTNDETCLLAGCGELPHAGSGGRCIQQATSTEHELGEMRSKPASDRVPEFR